VRPIPSERRPRLAGLAALIALAALAGCGGGGKKETAATAPSQTQPPPATETTPTSTQTSPTQTNTSPEDQPGGAGDEQANSSKAEFTGRDGDIHPATIEVPAFIAVKVILRSADGASYAITVAGHDLSVGGGEDKASVTLSGLRPGRSYAVLVVGAPERLRILATAP
jgi:hypothetical protein